MKHRLFSNGGLVHPCHAAGWRPAARRNRFVASGLRACRAALALLGLPGAAWAGDPCDELPRPAVVVQRQETAPVFNTGYGYRTLTNLGADAARPGRQVLGLTRGQAVVRFATRLPSVRDAAGRWECASPQITVSYGFEPLTVYVAREFPPESCAHRVILDHEMRHAAVYRKHLAAIEAEISATLSARFATGAVWRLPPGQIAGKLQGEFDERWIPYIRRLIAASDAEQATIDSDEEYERIARACDGEIARRIRGQRN